MKIVAEITKTTSLSGDVTLTMDIAEAVQLVRLLDRIAELDRKNSVPVFLLDPLAVFTPKDVLSIEDYDSLVRFTKGIENAIPE